QARIRRKKRSPLHLPAQNLSRSGLTPVPALQSPAPRGRIPPLPDSLPLPEAPRRMRIYRLQEQPGPGKATGQQQPESRPYPYRKRPTDPHPKSLSPVLQPAAMRFQIQVPAQALRQAPYQNRLPRRRLLMGQEAREQQQGEQPVQGAVPAWATQMAQWLKPFAP